MKQPEPLCRWSTDNWSCDLLIRPVDLRTAPFRGWITHVARHRYPSPPPPVDNSAKPDEWLRQVSARMLVLDGDRVPINGPCDGAVFHDVSVDLLHDRLVMLRGAGYRFPDRLLDPVLHARRATRGSDPIA